MRKLLRVFSPLLTLFFLSIAAAHEGHDHMPVTMKKAVEIALATARDASFAAQPALGLPQLEQSWRDLPVGAAQIVENGRGYYLVRVENPSQTKILHLKILLDGRVEAANVSDRVVSSAATSAIAP